jgi:hypothetical protein
MLYCQGLLTSRTTAVLQRVHRLGVTWRSIRVSDYGATTTVNFIGVPLLVTPA